MHYTVAEEIFPNKDALTQRARLALNRTPDGQPATKTDTEFLLALLQHHDEWVEKSAGGVREITTQTTVHGTRCFVLRKHDATEIDISFQHAIRQIPSHRTADILPQSLLDFKNAARSAVKKQIFAFRDEALKQPQSCPETNERLSRNNAHVDHEPPNTFDVLVFEFCKNYNIKPREVQVASELGVVAAFEDQALLERWQLFHQNHAKLRLVSKDTNLKLPKSRVAWTELWS